MADLVRVECRAAQSDQRTDARAPLTAYQSSDYRAAARAHGQRQLIAVLLPKGAPVIPRAIIVIHASTIGIAAPAIGSIARWIGARPRRVSQLGVATRRIPFVKAPPVSCLFLRRAELGAIVGRYLIGVSSGRLSRLSGLITRIFGSGITARRASYQCANAGADKGP